MNVKIWSETKDEGVVFLRLIPAKDVGELCGDGIMLCAVDENGNRRLNGNILRVTPNGTVELRSFINQSLGFTLTPQDGAIMTYVERG